MLVAPEESKLFFNLISKLMVYVAQQSDEFSHITSKTDFFDADNAEKAALRDFLFANLVHLENYVRENPNRLSDEQLDVVHKWKQGVKGTFFIERYLKKHAIFIQEDSHGQNNVYAVLGISQPIEDIFPRPLLPRMVQTVLLPFKNKIISDALYTSQNIFFGGGVKSRLKSVYMEAKQNGEIIEDLLADRLVTKKKIAHQLWQQEVATIAEMAKKLRGGQGQPEINSAVFSLLRASAELTNLAVNHADDENALLKAFQKAKRALSKVERHLYVSEWGWHL